MLAGVCVPQEGATVVAGRCKQMRVRAEVYRVDVGRMPAKCAQLASRRYIPNLDRVIRAAGSQQSTIATEGHLRNAFAVTLECSDLATTRYVPKRHLSFRPRRLRRGGCRR